MIKPVIIETNTNTGSIWHVKRGERKRVEVLRCRRVKRTKSANEGEKLAPV